MPWGKQQCCVMSGYAANMRSVRWSPKRLQQVMKSTSRRGLLEADATWGAQLGGRGPCTGEGRQQEGWSRLTLQLRPYTMCGDS